MLVFVCICVHDGAVCLEIRGLRHMCTGSRRSCGLSLVALWNHVGKSVVRPLLFFKRLFSAVDCFLIMITVSLPLPLPFSFFVFLFPLLSPCERCPDVPVWGLIAGLWGLLAMGAFYHLGGWLIIVEAPGHPRHPPSTQHDAVVNVLYLTVIVITCVTILCNQH